MKDNLGLGEFLKRTTLLGEHVLLCSRLQSDLICHRQALQSVPPGPSKSCLAAQLFERKKKHKKQIPHSTLHGGAYVCQLLCDCKVPMLRCIPMLARLLQKCCNYLLAVHLEMFKCFSQLDKELLRVFVHSKKAVSVAWNKSR
jgi:hypothetical protein